MLSNSNLDLIREIEVIEVFEKGDDMSRYIVGKLKSRARLEYL